MSSTVTDFAKIGKYEVLEQAGKGSFGVVYRGRDPFLKRDVAIKLCTVEDEEFRKRFFREAEIAGRLQHKNIVTVFAFGFEDDKPYLVQEFLTGEDLRHVIRNQAVLEVVEKIDILIQIAEGLAHAHAQGVVHRDIKPANVRRLEDGTVKILDFGIAKLAGAETQLTQAGVTLGTATYLSPEQVRGSEVDPRADQFSFGVLAYELLTYRRPFQGNTLSALVYQILYKPPVAMRRAWTGCPETLAKIIERCLEKEPEQRFQSFEELARELQAVREEVAASPRQKVSSSAVSDRATFTEPVRVGPRRSRPERAGRGRVATAQEATAAVPVDLAETVRLDVASIPAEPAGPQPAHPDPDQAGPTAGEASGDDKAARGDATQPIPLLKLEEDAPPAAPAEPSPPPAVEEPSRESPSDLVLTAQEISELVAQGDFEAARRQLDATIEQQAIEPSSDAAVPAVEPPAAVPPPLPETAAHPQLERPPDDLQRPGRDRPIQAGRARDLLAGGLTALSRLPPPARWGLLAAVPLLAVVIGLILAPGSREEELPVESPPVAPPPPPVEPVPAAPVRLTAVVNALPWARVTEIVRLEDGARVELPEEDHTPVALELEEGTYRVSLENLDYPQAEATTCEITVGADVQSPTEETVLGDAEDGVEPVDAELEDGQLDDGSEAENGSSCTLVFHQASALEYFKESGWWQ